MTAIRPHERIREAMLAEHARGARAVKDWIAESISGEKLFSELCKSFYLAEKRAVEACQKCEEAKMHWYHWLLMAASFAAGAVGAFLLICWMARRAV